ncbi:MAG: hypothetical protein Q9182_002272 [Xanthomendoza sp. 2 TL-2023]
MQRITCVNTFGVSIIRASYQRRVLSVPSSLTSSNTRFLSQTACLAYPRKDSQHKDSINTEATEYSKSGTDDASARQEDTAFDPGVTDPGNQKDKVGSRTANPGANRKEGRKARVQAQERQVDARGLAVEEARRKVAKWLEGVVHAEYALSAGQHPLHKPCVAFWKSRRPRRTLMTELKNLGEIVGCVEHLLKAASVNGSSSNIAFLDGLIHSRNNIGLLCKSHLFEWAKEVQNVSSPLSQSRAHARSVLDSSVGETSPEDTDSGGDSYQATCVHHPSHGDEVHGTGSDGLPGPARAVWSTRQEGHVRQLSAKLHCLYGVAIQSLRASQSPSSRHGHDLRKNAGFKVHPFARAKVYDLRQHTELTLWGPFHNDGSQDVDWEKLEAIMVILSYNIYSFSNRYIHGSNLIPPWDTPFTGVTPYGLELHPSRSSVERPPPLPIVLQDPYNITGTWMRVVCFLDYRELFTFNFSNDQPEPDQPRPAIDTEEAIRFITVKLQVTKIEKPGEFDGQALPIVHFKGSSHSALPPVDFNANSKIRGTVRPTPGGEVRWTTFSVFHGEERWRSEGIQLGGVQAARGVLGYWFDKDFDEYGPAGPTAFWKVSNDTDYNVKDFL